VQQSLAERLGLVPLRERVIALPRDRRWNSMARASLRDDLAAEQASLTADVVALRSSDADTAKAAERLVVEWQQSWTPQQARAAAQLADITAGERLELAELLVAVRTIRGLLRRT
jgi:glutamate dehydrogenase